MTTIKTDTAEKALARLWAQAEKVGERYGRERAVAEKTRAELVVPTVLALSAPELKIRQGEIADRMGLHRATVAAWQKEAGLTRTRRSSRTGTRYRRKRTTREES